MKAPKPASEATSSTLAWWSSPGLIYFLAAGNPPIAVKIGMAAITGKHSLKTALARRISQIQSSNHELIEILGVIHFQNSKYPTREAEVMERKLHIEFRHLQRFKSNSRGAEWFTPSEDLFARIDEISTKPEALDLLKCYSRLASADVDD